ncbi:hypothetical protein [Nocardia sp. NPDC052566]|uniref:hypothetical protein n=1 Tax=Nocardia sp. NPDC052566 TaxID=3364330 RepID=UPI0037CC18FA
MVVERADSVVVAYEAASTGYHADHIVLHEIAHLLLGHGDSSDAQRRTIQALFPEFDTDSVLRVLARGIYDDVQEHHAELFASLIMSTTDPAHSVSVFGRALFRD